MESRWFAQCAGPRDGRADGIGWRLVDPRVPESSGAKHYGRRLGEFNLDQFCRSNWQDFTFSANLATILRLPVNLIQINVLGKSKKGLLVHTTQPVNLVVHDFSPSAGDATQIFPDEALDTSYVVAARGLWGDVGEHNK